MTPPILGIWASQASGHLWAPAGAYDALATVTLSGATSSITFAGIPSGYTHLQIRGLVLNTSGSNNMALQFNGSGGTAYSAHQVQGDGTTTYGNASTSSPYAYLEGLVTASTTAPFVAIYDILDYANTSKYKTVRGLSGQDRIGAGTVQLTSGLWQSSLAITSINISSPGYNLGQYTTFALYGVK